MVFILVFFMFGQNISKLFENCLERFWLGLRKEGIIWASGGTKQFSYSENSLYAVSATTMACLEIKIYFYKGLTVMLLSA